MIKSVLARGIAVLGLAVLGMTAQAEPFRLVVTHLEPPLVPNSVMDLALELGYFAREGVEVELVRVQQTPLALAAILAGEGDMANVSVDAVLQLHGQGNTALRAVTSPNRSLPFLIAARAGIDGIEALSGHSFGVGRIGSLDHALSSRVLAAKGVPMETLELVTLGQPAIRAQALVAGRVDATTMSIGTWLSIPDKSAIRVLIEPGAYYAAAPVVNKVNVVTTDVLEARHSEVVAVVRALTRISRDFAADPQAWAAAMAPYHPQMQAQTLRDLAESFAGGWSVNAGLGREELQATQDWIYATDDFKGVNRIALDDWVEFSIADAVLKDLGTDATADVPTR